MKTSFASLLGLSLLGHALAHPAIKRQLPPALDGEILQFAIGLEFLSIAFYKDGLSKFTERDFIKAGQSPGYFSNLLDITFDEEFHAALLEDALGQLHITPNKPCTYKFPFHDVPSFIALASVLEGVATSAYQGGVLLIKTALLADNAEAILPVEAMHDAIQRSADGETILGNPRIQPLTPNEVTTLIEPFIVECPSTNAALPFKAFPPLAVKAPGPFKQNKEISFSVGNGTLPSTFFATFISGHNTKSVIPTDIKGNTFKAPVGSNMAGQTYVVVSSVNSNGTLSENNILFGPAAIEVLPLPRNITAFDASLN